MLLDKQLTFSDAQAVTSTIASTNSVDLRVVNSKIGTGEPLYIRVGVETALTDGSATVITVTLEGDSDSAMGSTATIQTLGTFASESVAGTGIVARIDPSVVTERYMQLKYTSSVGDLTGGAFDAHILHGVDLYSSYPMATVSKISGN